MRTEAFKDWLSARRLQPKSQRDTVSRCKRVERIANVDLDEVVDSESELMRIERWLAENARAYIDGSELAGGASYPAICCAAVC